MGRVLILRDAMLRIAPQDEASVSSGSSFETALRAAPQDEVLNTNLVMPGLVPGIHAFTDEPLLRRGSPGQARALTDTDNRVEAVSGAGL